MKIRILRIIISLMGFCITHTAYTQNMQTHFTYFADSTSIGAETRQRVSDLLVGLEQVFNHPEIAANIPVDVVFLHTDYMGSLQFKDNVKHNALQHFVQWWNSQYENDLRILFFFTNNGDQYQLSHFEATPNVRDLQLPVLVYNYINEQIINPYANQPIEAVYWGLNAVKNAFDRRFMENLVYWGPRLLEFSYYYKGYAYITHPYYYFDYEATTRTGVLSNPLVYYNNGHYYPVYLQSVPTQRAVVFDYVIGHNMFADLGGGTYLDLFQENMANLYTNPFHGSYSLLSHINISFQKKDILNFAGTQYSDFDSLPEGGLKAHAQSLINSKQIKRIEPNPADNNKMHITDGELIRSNSSYRIYQDTLNGFDRSLERIGTQVQVDSISPKMGWSVNWWSGFSYSQPTWCNVYAMDLSYKVYGLIGGDSPVPYGGGNNTANKLYEYFDNNSDYVKLNPYYSNAISPLIWDDFVNLGFPIYFAKLGAIDPNSGNRGSGHIETAFPFNNQTLTITKYNKMYFSEQNRNSWLNTNSKEIVIGAGSRTGYKSLAEFSSFFVGDNIGAFIYLGYLKNDNY